MLLRSEYDFKGVKTYHIYFLKSVQKIRGVFMSNYFVWASLNKVDRNKIYITIHRLKKLLKYYIL